MEENMTFSLGKDIMPYLTPEAWVIVGVFLFVVFIS
jgi:hypothetical protein